METTTDIQPLGYLPLIRQNPDYRNLWLGQVVSLLGDWFNLIASATLIAALTRSGFAVGGLFIVRMLSQFLMGPFGGVLADRFNRKSILIVSDLMRAVIVLGFLLVRDAGDVWLLYTLTALQLGVSGIFIPTKDAILPDIVSEQELGAANALNATTWSTMLALGAALGGVVAGQWGLAPSFIIDSLTFIVSAALIWRINYPTGTGMGKSASGPVQVFRQYFDGMRYLLQNGHIFILAVQKASMALAVSSMFSILQVEIASRVFVLGEGGSTSLGLFYASVGVGTGVSPILARYFTRDQEPRLRVAIAWGYLITGVGMLIVSSLMNFGMVLFGAFLRGFGVAIVWVFSTQLLLEKLPNRIRGRVFGTEYALFTLMNALGAAVGGALMDRLQLGIPQMIWGMTALLLVLGALWLAFGLKGQRFELQVES